MEDLDDTPTPEISVRIVDVNAPILRHPRWMELSFPDDINEDTLVEVLKKYLETTEELAKTTATQQIKIPTKPEWTKLASLGFSPVVYFLNTTPSALTKLPSKEYTIEESSNPKEIRKLIEAHFKFHAEYKPEYFTSEISKRVEEFIAHADASIADGTALLIVARLGSTPVGLTYNECIEGDGYIEEMFVIEPERNKGIGTAMLKKSAEFFEKNQCANVSAHVGIDAPALKFYETRGFERKSLNWIKNL